MIGILVNAPEFTPAAVAANDMMREALKGGYLYLKLTRGSMAAAVYYIAICQRDSITTSGYYVTRTLPRLSHVVLRGAIRTLSTAFFFLVVPHVISHNSETPASS